jgi:hypothetical protein
VITDLGMRYVDGRGFAAAVKRTSPATPVNLLTGWASGWSRGGDFPRCVDRVLAKPPELRELREALAQVCLMTRAEKPGTTERFGFGIRARLIFLVLVATVPLLMVVAYTMWVMRDVQDAEMRADLEYLARSASDQLKSEAESGEQLLNTLSQVPGRSNSLPYTIVKISLQSLHCHAISLLSGFFPEEVVACSRKSSTAQ